LNKKQFYDFETNGQKKGKCQSYDFECNGQKKGKRQILHGGPKFGV